MFIEKSSTEIVSIENEIKVVGLNLQNSGLPITFDSLGKMWGIYSDEHIKQTNNVKMPIVNYGICLNRVPDYLVGTEVTEYGEIGDEYFSFTIPAGRYIKDSFNGETFDKLVNESLEKRNVKKWAKENNLKINGEFFVEVYPIQEMLKLDRDITLSQFKVDDRLTAKQPEMYTLTPIK